MSDVTRNTLSAARNLLWQLLVEHDRGMIDLRGDWRAQVDTMEKICTDVLEYTQDAEPGQEGGKQEL